MRHSDVEEGFAQANRVFDHTFCTQQVIQTPLEPSVSVAESTFSKLTIYTS
ncbi:MAG: molybdopterin cofactor-binding domain-containing protein [Xanthobacteraceae bacterium]